MIIRGTHPSVVENYRGFLTARAASGQPTFSMQSVADLAVGDFLVLGIPGEDATEIKRIQSIAGKVVTLSANLDNTHAENTKVYVIRYDKIRLYKAPSRYGSYVQQGSTKDIAIGEKYTLFEDTDALSTDYYKVAYYNSYTSLMSPMSSPIGDAGFGRDSLSSIVYGVFKAYGDIKQKFLTREEIVEWVNEAKDDLCNEVAESNEKYFNAKVTLTGDADGESDLPATFKKSNKVKVSYSGVEANSRRASMTSLDLIDDERFLYDAGNPVWYYNNGRIGVRPKNQTPTIYLWHEAHPDDMVDDADTLPRPINRYPHVVGDYCMAKAYEKGKNTRLANYYSSKYESGKATMVEHINNIVMDENKNIRDDEELYA